VQEEFLHYLNVVSDFSFQHWPTVRDWTAEHWPGGAAIISLVLGVSNRVSASRADRKKNKREEFHRRVATRIENALEQFRTIADGLHDCKLTGKPVEVDTVLFAAQTAQRKLSREMRLASDCGMCSSHGWEGVGNADYDRFMEHLEMLRLASAGEYSSVLSKAIAALEAQDAAVYARINEELRRYT
jgi:hypothetical protein